MCTGDLFRLAIPEDSVNIRHKKGYGYNNGGFILRHKDERLQDLVNHYCVNLGYDYPIRIPCQKCVECRLEYTKQWAQRLVCESTLYQDNWFITLTYDEDHLIDCIDYTVSPWTGNLDYVASLRKEHFTKFKKDFLEYMRSHYGITGIRFYMCGEYGSKNHRPHFHAILFNCPFPDLKLVKNVSLGGFNYCYYHSEILAQKWGRGFVMLGSVNWNTCSYVARYVMKKMQGSDSTLYRELCDLEGVSPITSEYVNMSRRPGIARDYYEHNFREIYNVDKVVLPDGKSVKPAKYFDRLFDIEYFDELEKIKENRKRNAELRYMNKYKGLHPFQVETIKQQESEALIRRLSKLQRNI